MMKSKLKKLIIVIIWSISILFLLLTFGGCDEIAEIEKQEKKEKKELIKNMSMSERMEIIFKSPQAGKIYYYGLKDTFTGREYLIVRTNSDSAGPVIIELKPREEETR